MYKHRIPSNPPLLRLLKIPSIMFDFVATSSFFSLIFNSDTARSSDINTWHLCLFICQKVLQNATNRNNLVNYIFNCSFLSYKVELQYEPRKHFKNNIFMYKRCIFHFIKYFLRISIVTNSSAFKNFFITLKMGVFLMLETFNEKN